MYLSASSPFFPFFIVLILGLVPLASCLAHRASRLRYSTTYQPSAFRVSRSSFAYTLPFSVFFSAPLFPRFFCRCPSVSFVSRRPSPNRTGASLSSPNGRTSGSFFSDTASRRSPSVSDKRDLENGLPRIRQPNSPLRQIGLRIPGCMYTPVSRTQIHPPREHILFLFLSFSLTFSVSRASNRLLSVPATQNLPPTVELARSPAALGPPRRSKHCFRGPLPSGALLSLHLSRYAELDFYAEPMHPLRTCFSYRYQPLPIHSIVLRG